MRGSPFQEADGPLRRDLPAVATVDGSSAIAHATGWLLDRLPEDSRNSPEARLLAQQAYPPIATVVQLKYQAKKYETAGKIFEFSRRTMEEHWRAGYEDTMVALHEPAVFELPDVSEGARIFDVHHGWLK